MKNIKRYGMGGAVQSFSSPMLAQGMQGGLSGFGTSGIGMFAKGGKIIDQYDGRTPEDIWNNLSKSQRQHFIYDHLEEIAEYKGFKEAELPSSEVIKAYNSDWKTLDKDIKNRFANHTREGQYAKGGKLQIVSRNKGSWGYLRFEGAIGSFQWKYDKRYPEGILYPLDGFDRDITRDEKLKKGEVIFRYETEMMRGRMRPLIKFNLDKSLVYFGVDAEDGEVKFETKGTKLEYILLEEGYEEIYAKGGEVEDENQYDFSIRVLKDNLDVLNEDYEYEDFRGTKEEVLKKVNDSISKGEIVYAYIGIEGIVTDWYHESGDLERMRMELNRYGENDYAKGGKIANYKVGDLILLKYDIRYGREDSIPHKIVDIDDKMLIIEDASKFRSKRKVPRARVDPSTIIPFENYAKEKLSIIKSYAKGGEVDKEFPIGYIMVVQERFEDYKKAEKILKKHGIQIDASKDFHTKGFADELYGEFNNGVETYVLKFDINDAPNPQSLVKDIDAFEKKNPEVAVQFGKYYAKGGEVEQLQVGDIVTHKKGRQYGHGKIYKISDIGIFIEDKYGNKREKPFYFPNEFKKVSKMFGEGGKADVYIENKDVKFDKKRYKGILSDFDLDGLPNVDDPDPFGNQDKSSIEQVKFSNTFNKVLDTKKNLDSELKKFVSKLQKSTSSTEKIYARAKTPFSILNKLVDSRLLDEKRGLKDLVGTTITFQNLKDLENYKRKVRRGDMGKVLDYDDYYTNPNDGYRAYHFVIDQDGVPIELQLKTDRMKEVNILSHDAYKNKNLNKDYMLYLTNLADKADNGDELSKERFLVEMSDKGRIRKMLSAKN